MAKDSDGSLTQGSEDRKENSSSRTVGVPFSGRVPVEEQSGDESPGRKHMMENAYMIGRL